MSSLSVHRRFDPFRLSASWMSNNCNPKRWTESLDKSLVRRNVRSMFHMFIVIRKKITMNYSKFSYEVSWEFSHTLHRVDPLAAFINKHILIIGTCYWMCINRRMDVISSTYCNIWEEQCPSIQCAISLKYHFRSYFFDLRKFILTTTNVGIFFWDWVTFSHKRMTFDWLKKTTYFILGFFSLR